MAGMTVGFVGLGAMGQGMAANLVRAGHPCGSGTDRTSPSLR